MQSERPDPYAAFEAEDRCECGVLLADHAPLPKPGPLVGWRASRLDSSRSWTPAEDHPYTVVGTLTYQRAHGPSIKVTRPAVHRMTRSR